MLFIHPGVTCMSLGTEEMISSWVEFAEKATASTDGGFNRQYFRDFMLKLRAFNDDPANAQTRPYFFIHRLVDSVDPVSEGDLNRLLLEADSLGLAVEFEKVRHDDGLIALYFSHAAVPLATDLCEKHGFGYANLGSNGLCVPGFAFTGLATASPERVKESVIDAKVYLVGSVGDRL